MNNDIIKGLVYDRGSRTQNGQTKFFSLVCMVIASDKPLLPEDRSQIIVMGACDNISERFNNLPKYDLPYKMGEIGLYVLDVSNMTPEYLSQRGLLIKT